MTERKNGRPGKDESPRQKTVAISIRFTEEERDLIAEAAKKDMRTTSDWIRKTVLVTLHNDKK